MKNEVFKKELSGGDPENIYTANSDACICSMAFEGQRLYWAQDGVIHSADPNNPHETHVTRPALQAQNGIGIIGDIAYWTAIDKVYSCPATEDGDLSTVKDMGTTDCQLNGLVVVKP